MQGRGVYSNFLTHFFSSLATGHLSPITKQTHEKNGIYFFKHTHKSDLLTGGGFFLAGCFQVTKKKSY